MTGTAIAPVRRVWRDVDGVVLLDKPAGISSNTALQIARRLYSARKAGHTGTLDPLATGLLVLCFGEATKFSTWALRHGKRYTGEIQLGARTTTGDAEGEIVERQGWSLDHVDLSEIAARFTGVQSQLPPIYSALKRNGKPLYEYARAGVEVVVEPREVTIHALRLEALPNGRVGFEVACSSGTYVRSLAEDLAAAMGTVGHLAVLRRVASGPLDVTSAETPEALKAMSEATRATRLLPVDALVSTLPAVALDAGQSSTLGHGQIVPQGPGHAVGHHRAYGSNGRFLGVVDRRDDGALRVVRLMAQAGPADGAEKSI